VLFIYTYAWEVKCFCLHSAITYPHYRLEYSFWQGCHFEAIDPAFYYAHIDSPRSPLGSRNNNSRQMCIMYKLNGIKEVHSFAPTPRRHSPYPYKKVSLCLWLINAMKLFSNSHLTTKGKLSALSFDLWHLVRFCVFSVAPCSARGMQRAPHLCPANCLHLPCAADGSVYE
jgi:hypothetical protein